MSGRRPNSRLAASTVTERLDATLRKASLAGAAVSFINPAKFEYRFNVAAYVVSNPAAQVEDLAAVLAAVAKKSGAAIPKYLAAVARGAKVSDAHQAVAAALLSGPKRAVWLGALALRHPRYADLRALVSHAHDGALAELPLDLGQRALKRRHTGLRGLVVFCHGHLRAPVALIWVAQLRARRGRNAGRSPRARCPQSDRIDASCV